VTFILLEGCRLTTGGISRVWVYNPTNQENDDEYKQEIPMDFATLAVDVIAYSMHPQQRGQPA
jgi:hypothetical protein